MSRVSTLEQMMIAAQPKRKFDFDKLNTIPISCLLSSEDINELISIATSIRFNANIYRKYEAMDAVMRRRGFIKAHAGTNRRIYRFLEDSSFVAKVAVDKVGMQDSPQEYVHQVKFQPFCCKIFEVHPSGVVAFVEKVNPITSLEEMISVADDIFNLMVTKIVGKYVVDDLGTKTYMNFGVRPFFGPVILDFPYVYELDPEKLICRHKVKDQFGIERACGGEIDIVPGFNGYRCLKCGREYKAIDLGKTKISNFNLYEWDNREMSSELRKMIAHFRSQVVDCSNGKIILDSGRKSNLYLSKEECDVNMTYELPAGFMDVDKTIHDRHIPAQQMRLQYYSDLQRQAMERQIQINMPKIRDLMEDGKSEFITVNETIKNPPFNPKRYEPPKPIYDDFEATDGSMIEVAVMDDGPTDTIIPADAQTAGYKIAQVLNNAVTCQNSSLDLPLSAISQPTQPIPTQIYNDEQVKAMADEVAIRNVDVEDGSSSNAAIIDPEQDKNHPEISPMTRSYAQAKESVYVTAKMEAKHKVIEAPKVVFTDHEEDPTLELEEEFSEGELNDQNMTDTEKAMFVEVKSEDPEEEDPKVKNDSDVPLEVAMPDSDKAFRKADYEKRKKNGKRRTGYDDDE